MPQEPRETSEGLSSINDEVLRFHKFLLSDTGARLDIYRQALEQCVKSGDTVIDFGAGTGILAFLAARAGASRVYAIERGPVAHLAPMLARENGLQDHVVVFHGSARDFTPVEPVDLIVFDTCTTCGLRSGALTALLDLRRRCLKPDGRLMPSSLSLQIAPVEHENLFAETVGFWDRECHGFSLSAVRPIAANQRYAARFDPRALLGDAVTVWQQDLLTTESFALSGEAATRIARRGVMHGLAAWFAETLTGELSLTNRPGASNTNFRQAFFPLSSPVEVEPRDEIHVRLSSIDDAAWRWRVEVVRAGAVTRHEAHAIAMQAARRS